MADLRAAMPSDHTGIGTCVSEAFGEEEGTLIGDLVDDLRPEHARVELVAVEGDGEGEEVVGHVLLSRSWVDARQELVEVMVLSPLSVRPSHQRSGVGTRLLAAAVEAAREEGAPAVFLEGDPGFYGARGWEPGAGRGFARPSVRIPEPAFQVVVLESHEEWMTGALVYCEPFWLHDCVGLRDPLLARLEQAFD